MSAWIVDRAHIDVMLRAGMQYGRAGWHGNLSWVVDAEGETFYRELTPESADEIGRMLWSENVASIEYRYPDTAETHEGYPGPVSFEREQAAEYVYCSPRIGALTPGEVFKLVACYEYQSCEHPAWQESEAKRFCTALEGAVAASLYEGPWGWSADDIAARKAVPA